jgi:predicted dehydrogenase
MITPAQPAYPAASVRDYCSGAYTLQGDAFSRAVLGEAPLEFPIEDAIANMRVIDAAFRSARSGGWEKP